MSFQRTWERSLEGFSSQSCKESDRTEVTQHKAPGAIITLMMAEACNKLGNLPQNRQLMSGFNF